MLARPLLATLLVAFVASSVGAAPQPMPFEFVRLKGLDAKAGVFTKIPGTKRVVRTEPRTVVRMVNGIAIQQVVTVQVPVVVSVLNTLDTNSHNAYDGNGRQIPAATVFERLKEGQLVLISKSPDLPNEYLKLLAPDTVILAPKPSDATDTPKTGTGSGE